MKSISIDLGGGKTVTGFAALRETGSTSGAGFALLRRGRLIEGSGDEGYRPESIFGRSNSFVFQRLFGELQLDGFEVSHTKDGFKWDETEEDFLELLKSALDSDPMPLLSQAREHRSRVPREELVRTAARAMGNTADAIEKRGGAGIRRALREGAEAAPASELPGGQMVFTRLVSVTTPEGAWEITLEASPDPCQRDWVEVMEHQPKRGVRRLGVRVALAHSFTERFAGADAEALEPLVRIAAALAIAEATARGSGVRRAGTVRRHFNDLLRESFSRPLKA